MIKRLKKKKKENKKLKAKVQELQDLCDFYTPNCRTDEEVVRDYNDLYDKSSIQEFHAEMKDNICYMYDIINGNKMNEDQFDYDKHFVNIELMSKTHQKNKIFLKHQKIIDIWNEDKDSDFEL